MQLHPSLQQHLTVIAVGAMCIHVGLLSGSRPRHVTTRLDQATLTLIAELDMAGIGSTPIGLALDDQHHLLFIATGSTGVKIADVSDPRYPKLLMDPIRDADKITYADSVSFVDDQLFVAGGATGIYRIRRNPTQSEKFEIGDRIKLRGEAQDISVRNGLVFVASGSEGLQILQTSMATQFQPLCKLDTTFARSVLVAPNDQDPFLGSLAFVAEGGLRIVDIQKPSACNTRGFIDGLTDVGNDLAIDNNTLYLATGLTVHSLALDLPAAPRIKATFQTQGIARAIAVSQGRLAVAEGNEGVSLWDVSNSLPPSKMVRDEGPLNATDVLIEKDVLYVTDASESPRLLVYKIGPGQPPSTVVPDPLMPITPTEIPTVPPPPTPVPTEGAKLHGRVLLNGKGLDGLWVALVMDQSGADSTVDTAETDGDGFYRFRWNAPLGLNASYQVRWYNRAKSSQRLADWTTASIRRFDGLEDKRFDDFDVSGLDLISPSASHESTLPLTYAWKTRFLPWDTYRIVIRNRSDDTVHWTSDNLQHTSTWIMKPELPPVLYYQKDYCWTISIQSTDGGHGTSWECRDIRFAIGPTPTGTQPLPTSRPSATETATRTPTATQTITPSPTAQKTPRGKGIHGHLVANGKSVPNSKVSLVRHSTSGQDNRTVMTDRDGLFEFKDVARLGPDEVLVVEWYNEQTVAARLATWRTHEMKKYDTGTDFNVGDLDVSDILLGLPDSEAPIPFPVQFRWTPRNHASDNYGFLLTDSPSGQAVSHIAYDLGRSDSYSLSGLPPGASPGKTYDWTVFVSNDDGTGTALRRAKIAFLQDKPWPTPTLQPPSTPISLSTSDFPRSVPSVSLPLVTYEDTPGRWIGAWIHRVSRELVRGEYHDRLGSTVEGKSISGVQLQNTSSDPSQGVITLLAQHDTWCPLCMSEPFFNGEITLRYIANPGAPFNLWMPSLPAKLTGATIPRGSYMLRADADRDVAAIIRTDWPRTLGSILYSSPRVARDIIVPLVLNNYQGQSSIITIADHSRDRHINQVHLFLTDNENPTHPPLHRTIDIRPGESVTDDLASNYYKHTLGLRPNFVGSMRVVSSGGDIAVSAINYFELSGSRAVAGFEGIPVNEAARVLYAPLIRHRDSSGTRKLDTGISVYNPGASPVRVRVTYIGSEGNCIDEVKVHGPKVIESNASVVFYQGPGPDERYGLTRDCVGSAIIQAERQQDRIMAIVQDSEEFTSLMAAYNAVPEALASRRVALPLIRYEHAGLTTAIQVMNAGAVDAKATILFQDSQGREIARCGMDCEMALSPNQAGVFWPGRMTVFTQLKDAAQSAGRPFAGVYGSALVNSSQPVVVVVSDYSILDQPELKPDMAEYNGIPLRDR